MTMAATRVVEKTVRLDELEGWDEEMSASWVFTKMFSVAEKLTYHEVGEESAEYDVKYAGVLIGSMIDGFTRPPTKPEKRVEDVVGVEEVAGGREGRVRMVLFEDPGETTGLAIEWLEGFALPADSPLRASGRKPSSGNPEIDARLEEILGKAEEEPLVVVRYMFTRNQPGFEEEVKAAAKAIGERLDYWSEMEPALERKVQKAILSPEAMTRFRTLLEERSQQMSSGSIERVMEAEGGADGMWTASYVVPDAMQAVVEEHSTICAAYGCEKEGTATCAACKSVRYCGKACQKKDWKLHKKECKKKRVTIQADAMFRIRVAAGENADKFTSLMSLRTGLGAVAPDIRASADIAIPRALEDRAFVVKVQTPMGSIPHPASSATPSQVSTALSNMMIYDRTRSLQLHVTLDLVLTPEKGKELIELMAQAPTGPAKAYMNAYAKDGVLSLFLDKLPTQNQPF